MRTCTDVSDPFSGGSPQGIADIFGSTLGLATPGETYRGAADAQDAFERAGREKRLRWLLREFFAGLFLPGVGAPVARPVLPF